MSDFRGVKNFPGLVHITPINSVDTPFLVKDVNGTQVFSIDQTGALFSGSGAVKVQTGEPVVFQAPIATAAVNQACFIADAAYQVVGVNAVWGTASSSGTVTVEKLTGTTAPGSGTALLTGTISTAATANTVTAGTLIATVATLQLAVGDRLGVVFSGTETSLVGLTVVVSLKRI